MLEHKGRDQGLADGRADGALNLPKRPRPDLALAIMFAGYRDTYLKNYGPAYVAQRQIEERLVSEQLKAKPIRSTVQKTTLRDRMFERGWKDGFNGKEAATWRMSEADKMRYQRGHAIGQRHREYDRAEQLRKSHRHQNLQNTQGKLR